MFGVHQWVLEWVEVVTGVEAARCLCAVRVLDRVPGSTDCFRIENFFVDYFSLNFCSFCPFCFSFVSSFSSSFRPLLWAPEDRRKEREKLLRSLKVPEEFEHCYADVDDS